MPRSRSKIIRFPTCRLTTELLVQVLGDPKLYDEFPALLPFKHRVVRLRLKIDRLQMNRDEKIRTWYKKLTQDFTETALKLANSGERLVGFARYMRIRHNIDAGQFICYAGDRRILLR